MTDITQYFLEKGMGEPLILLHGNGESSDYFCNQIEAFSKRYHVIALDTRGHGKTPRGDQPFTIRQFAQDLLCFMDERGIDRAHILGFSDGGNIAMVFAMNHPEYVNQLILNGANLCAQGVKRRVQIPIELGYQVANLCAKKSKNAMRNAEMLGLMVKEPNVMPMELAKIQAPTLVIAGSRDMIRAEHTKLIADSIPNAQLEIIEGDHFIAKKRPKDFNERVLRFLDS